MKAIPVFMYHHINRHQEDLVTLTPRDFENHLQVLAEQGIQTLFLDELVGFLRGGRPFPGRAAVLTFDDGHLDNWVYAFPLLKKYRMKATIFVITSWMGNGPRRKHWDGMRPDEAGLPAIPRHREVKKRAGEGDLSVALSWEEAREMEASGFVDIQSHTHFHREYFARRESEGNLGSENGKELFADLKRSQELIEANLRKPCRFLAWPWGKYDENAVDLARKAGFEGMATTEKGVNLPGSDPFAIKRIVAKSGDKRWFSTRIWIYAHPRIGKWYSRVVGRI